MTTITQIQEGKYAVSDGRSIIKDGINWYVINKEGSSDFGPVASFDAAKDFIEQSSSHAEAPVPEKNKMAANKGPATLWAMVMLAVCLLLLFIRNY